MKTGNLRNYLASGLASLAAGGIGGCGWGIHGDCFRFSSTGNFYYETREECEANGGDWGRWGLFPEERCNMRTSDYGAPCDGVGCDGVCIADENGDGFCSEHVTEFGCYEIIECGTLSEICRD